MQPLATDMFRDHARLGRLAGLTVPADIIRIAAGCLIGFAG